MALIRTFTPQVPSETRRYFDDELRDLWLSNFSNTQTSVPSVNVRETDDEFIVEVAAPGMKKDDFNVNLENDMLTVSSERKEEKEEKEREEAAYTRREFSYQSFQRTFTLPENVVDGDKIDAKYADGILRLVLPKLEHTKKKPSRQIKVS